MSGGHGGGARSGRALAVARARAPPEEVSLGRVQPVPPQRRKPRELLPPASVPPTARAHQGGGGVGGGGGGAAEAAARCGRLKILGLELLVGKDAWGERHEQARAASRAAGRTASRTASRAIGRATGRFGLLSLHAPRQLRPASVGWAAAKVAPPKG